MPASSPTQHLRDQCPDWCQTEHSTPAGLIVHEGERQTFEECKVQLGDGPFESVVLYLRRTVDAAGAILEDGAMLNGLFLDEDGLRAVRDGLRDARTEATA